jgi:hypothetical protein
LSEALVKNCAHSSQIWRLKQMLILVPMAEVALQMQAQG